MIETFTQETLQTATMSPNSLPVIVTKPILQGTPEYEAKREALLQVFRDKVPAEYKLAPEIISDPPVDVTGIPASCGILGQEELDITEKYDAVGLADAIASRKYTATTVTTAFLKRSIIAHQLTSCLTQWLPDEALARAKELDAHLETTGTTVGPLHGVPLSIKDHVPFGGSYSSQGCFASIVKDEEDSLMTDVLRRQGAVFYCKTNQPQALMHLESSSHWGRVLNPCNINLSAGGSTGGEAALIALKGSVLGVGTDIGGSVRAPAAFCGIYGLKTTSYVLPMGGFLPSPSSAELNILCSCGPMCRSLRDMDLFMRSMMALKPHLRDPRLIPTPWTGLSTKITLPLKIGIISNDGFIEPQPPVKRAVSWANNILSDPKYADKVQIKEFKPYGAAAAWSKIRRMYWPDGGKAVKDAVNATGEPMFALSEWIWKDAEPHGMLTAQDINLARRERDTFRLEFAKDWEAQDVDFVIGPAFVGPACAHDTAFYWTYTSLYNFVDYPGVSFPTPLKTEASEKYAENYEPLSDACKHVKELWESSDFQGAPIDLQINARKYHDNDLFGALEVLKDILNLP